MGFRPFTFRLALAHGLKGAVWNEPWGVVVDVEGEEAAIAAFESELQRSPPPETTIEGLQVERLPPIDHQGFAIRESAEGHGASRRVPPDLAACPECLSEVDTPGDRRRGYPFTSCVRCGPRYSIVRGLPYDRERTTMAGFAFCAACAHEYEDPGSRRFHAQTNACSDCGPRLCVVSDGPRGTSAVEEVVSALRKGSVVAIKGIGGFHVACDATNEEAVGRLRERKQRPDKPLAVMFPDLEALGRESDVDATAAALLTGSRRPIVLLPRRKPTALAPQVAPRLRQLGAFLPYTPLHHLVLRAFGRPLVMTSGNRSDEPLASSNDEARSRLRGIADLFLLHDRDIAAPLDDSVARVLRGRIQLLRRARGYVPEPLPLGFTGPPGLAVGADLKNAPCLATGDSAVPGPHVGDLESYEAQEVHTDACARLLALLGVEPAWIAHDLHPGYHGTGLAQAYGRPRIAVQHHHAHVASCLVDNARTDRVIGVAWDGTGYGPDGTVWGGEVLVADLSGFERVGRIRPVPLPGGDAAVREPWRMAVSHLLAAGVEAKHGAHPAYASVAAMVREGVNTVPTSSAGRLFDALASLLGVRDRVSYDGQAAVELEALAERTDDASGYHVPVTGERPLELDPRPLVRAVARDVARDADPGLLAGRIHAALADAILEACRRVRQTTGLRSVALTGGCFESKLLTVLAAERLEAADFEVLLHGRVPPGDGGLGVGQAAVAAWRTSHPESDSGRTEGAE